MTKVLTPVESSSLLVHLRPVLEMSDEQFFEFCQLNRDLRIERTAEGDLRIMPPTGGETSHRNAKLIMQVMFWAKQDQTGVVFDSSGGFDLPNRATRSPDVAWVRRSRLQALPKEQKQKFIPLCPDFVIELRSRSDSLKQAKDKIQEYIENGAQLGWLIDADNKRIYVYRPGKKVEQLDNAQTISGDPILPGFVLDLGEIWEPGF